jgi:hypothetical protein
MEDRLGYFSEAPRKDQMKCRVMGYVSVRQWSGTYESSKGVCCLFLQSMNARAELITFFPVEVLLYVD